MKVRAPVSLTLRGVVPTFRKPRRSLRMRIMVSAALGITALIFTLGVIGSQVIQSATDKVFEERRRTAEHLANHLDSALAGDAANLRLLAQSSLMRTDGKNLGPAKHLMKETYPQMLVFTNSLLLVDQSGRVIWSEPERPGYLGMNLTNLAPVRETLTQGKPRISGLLWNPAGLPVAVHAHPILDPDGQVKGAIVGEADLTSKTLLPYVAAVAPVGTEHGVIIDQDGWVLAGTIPDMVFTQEEHPELFTDLIKKRISTVAVTTRNNSHPGHEPHVMASAPLQNSAWSVSLGQSASEAMWPVTRLRWRITIFGLAAVLIAVVYAWWDAGAVTRPLRKLTAAAETIAAGDLDIPVQIHLNDEIGTLGAAFETMRTHLKDSRAELERALEETKRRERESAALYRVSREILSSFDLNKILQTVVDQARTLLGCDIALLCLIPDSGGAMQVRAASGDLPTGSSVMAGHDPCGQCPLVAELNPATHLAAPLISGDRVIGALCIANRQPLELRPEDESLLRGLANQAAIAIEHARLYDKVQSLAVFKERERIAREMHDSVSQTLSYLYTQLRLHQERLPQSTPTDLWAGLNEMASVASATYDEVRQAIFGLRATPTPREGLISAIAGSLRDFSARTGIPAELEGDAVGSAVFSPQAEAQLIRIIQEALNNIAKHSRAHRACVRIDSEGQYARVTIQDDGIGFDPHQGPGANSSSFGLLTMRERAESIGGTLEIQSAPGKGTEVVARIPLART